MPPIPRRIYVVRRYCRHSSALRSERSVHLSNPIAQALAKKPYSGPERLACLLLLVPVQRCDAGVRVAVRAPQTGTSLLRRLTNLIKSRRLIFRPRDPEGYRSNLRALRKGLGESSAMPVASLPEIPQRECHVRFAPESDMGQRPQRAQTAAAAQQCGDHGERD